MILFILAHLIAVGLCSFIIYIGARNISKHQGISTFGWVFVIAVQAYVVLISITDVVVGGISTWL